MSGHHTGVHMFETSRRFTKIRVTWTYAYVILIFLLKILKILQSWLEPPVLLLELLTIFIKLLRLFNQTVKQVATVALDKVHIGWVLLLTTV